MTSKSSNPCAACQSQRRRCSPDCQLAPFFPSDEPKRFEDARKLCGARNIIKNLRRVGDDPFVRSETMRAVTYEAALRANDKMRGATGEIIRLCQEIQRTKLELDGVRTQIEMNEVCCKSGLLNLNGNVNVNMKSPVESDDGEMGSFVNGFNGGISNELKVVWADESCNGGENEMKMYLADTDEEEMISELNQPSLESPLKSELEASSDQSMEIEHELEDMATFLASLAMSKPRRFFRIQKISSFIFGSGFSLIYVIISFSFFWRVFIDF